MGTIRSRRLTKIVRKFSQANLLIVGDVILDQFIWGKVTRISPEAPVPIVRVNRETFACGGAANVAHNVYSLQAHVALAGMIGDDVWGRELLGILAGHKVNTRGLIKCKGKRTILKTRVVAHNQQVVRVDWENGSCSQKKDLSKIYKFIKQTVPQVDGVIIEDYDKGLISQEMVDLLVALCQRYNKPLVVDPKKGHFLDYSRVTAITPNLSEALAFSGQEHEGEYNLRQVEKTGRFILKKWNLQALLITLGEHGMSLFEDGKKTVTIPSTVRQVYDVSGAGDTVVGVFTMALVSGATVSEAAYLANLAAGVVVAKVGTASLTMEELITAIKETGR